jgi:hypothetical protein
MLGNKSLSNYTRQSNENKARINRSTSYKYKYKFENNNNPYIKPVNIFSDMTASEMKDAGLSEISYIPARKLTKHVMDLSTKIDEHLHWARETIRKMIKGSDDDVEKQIQLEIYEEKLLNIHKNILSQFHVLALTCAQLSDKDNEEDIEKIKTIVKVIREILSDGLDIGFPRIRFTLMLDLNSVSGILSKLKKITKTDGNKTMKSHSPKRNMTKNMTKNAKNLMNNRSRPASNNKSMSKANNTRKSINTL